MARSGWPDLVFSDQARRESLSRAVAAGRLRRIARGIYTSSVDEPEAVTRRHLPRIVGHEFPGAVIVDRSARTGLAAAGGDLYVDHHRDRPLALPGVVIRPRPGPGPLPGDIALPDGAYLSSPARGLIDNLAGRGRRFLSRDEIEDWVAELVLRTGPDGLGEIRDLARDVARQADRMPAFEQLARIVASLLATGPAGAGRAGAGVPVMDPAVVAAAAPEVAGEGRAGAGGRGGAGGLVGAGVPVMDPGVVAAARAGGVGVGVEVEVEARPMTRAADGAVDPERTAWFEAAAEFLANDLTSTPYPDPPESAGRWLLLPFYEAYFSNVIEGVQFTLDRAATVVFDKMIPMAHPGDAHDLLGTYRLVSKPAEMGVVPGSAEEMLGLLRRRHHVIVDGRPRKFPGEFRTRSDPADSPTFVSPHLVEGTLRAGFAIGRDLRDPFARAVFMMLLVSEVHPFAAGNGCLARVMMNAELVAADELRIAIPAILRGEYLSTLAAASRQRSFQPICSVLDRARRWTSEVDFRTWASAERDATRTNALLDSIASDRANVRLILPSALEPVAG
jgi:hypothetical protein